MVFWGSPGPLSCYPCRCHWKSFNDRFPDTRIWVCLKRMRVLTPYSVSETMRRGCLTLQVEECFEQTGSDHVSLQLPAEASCGAESFPLQALPHPVPPRRQHRVRGLRPQPLRLEGRGVLPSHEASLVQYFRDTPSILPSRGRGCPQWGALGRNLKIVAVQNTQCPYNRERKLF